MEKKYWFTFQICYWDSIYNLIQDVKFIWFYFFENVNRLIIRDFWMVKFWPYFHKSIWIAISIFKKISCPKKYVFERFTWGIIYMDFVNFPFRILKLKNDIGYIKYKFSHRFEKVCKWLNMYYSKIRIITFQKVITMFIWIILKNLLQTYKECNFYRY